MFNYLVFGIVPLSSLAGACDQWFQKLKINSDKNCESLCQIAPTDMSTYMCPNRCESLCKNNNRLKKDENIYGLTDDEIKFCKENRVDCLEAYYESWNAEKICLSIYPVSDVNDESDACRHYVWSILLNKTIGDKNAELVLNAHENHAREQKDQQAMDLANNRLGLLNYQKFKHKLKTNEEIKMSFLEELKSGKLVILKPNYKNSGGLP